MLDILRELAESALERRVFPGCVLGVSKDGCSTITYHGAYSHDGAPVHAGTIYDLASVTKSIPTAALVALLIHEGKLAPSDLVRTHLPELRNDHGACIEDLLRYRVQGVRMSHIAHMSAGALHETICTQGFSGLPGASEYTNLPAYLLGVIVERVTGHSIDVCAHERFFGPLHMDHTVFSPNITSAHMIDVAPTEVIGGAEVLGEVHDESARVFSHAGKAVGHAGLFSTAGDVLLFLEALIGGGHDSVVQAAQKGLGWELNRGTFMGRYFGPRTFGKTGFTGTSIVCDTDRKIALVILSNRTHPTRPTDTSAINEFRRTIADAVFQGR